MNFQLTEEQTLIQKTSREFADTELAPGVVERDDKKIWPKEGIKKMAELGFMGMMTDPKWNGEVWTLFPTPLLWKKFPGWKLQHQWLCLLTILWFAIYWRNLRVAI